MMCKVKGCKLKVRSRGLCNAHYFRLWRTGKTGVAKIWDRKRRKCEVRGCIRLSQLHGYCLLHDRRIQKGGSSNFIGNQAWDKNSAWKGDSIGYNAAHDRVRSQRGPASEQECKCGEKAKHWSYTHADPKELRTEKGLPYSVDPRFYVALCVPCHKASDLRRRAVPPR